MAARNLAPSERAALRLKNLHRTRNDEFVPASFRRGSLNTAATDTLLSQSKQYDATNLSEFMREEKGILAGGRTEYAAGHISRVGHHVKEREPTSVPCNQARLRGQEALPTAAIDDDSERRQRLFRVCARP